MSDYRASTALGGSCARMACKDFEAWAFQRRLKLSGQIPPWCDDTPSAAMMFGTAVHMALLEPARFRTLAVPMPYVESFALKAGKEVKANAVALAELIGGFVLKVEEMWAIEHIQASFAPIAEMLGKSWEPEVEGYARLGDILLKGTADLLSNEWLVDLKTTRDISRIPETIASERYNVQLLHYDFLFPGRKLGYVFIENVAPFRCKFVELENSEVDRARTAWRMTMERIKEEGLHV